MQQSGVEVRYGSRVQALMTETAEDGALHVTGVRLMDGTALPAERVILATGGLSCPLTGSTGDGYRLAESVGHTTTPRMGVLSAIETDCDWCGRLQGMALKNVALTLKKGTVYAFRLEIPSESTGRALNDIQRMYGSFEPPEMEGDMTVITGTAPVVTMRDYQKEWMCRHLAHGFFRGAYNQRDP